MNKTCIVLMTLAAAASAQTKISGSGACGKPETQQMAEVGDRAGHVLTLVKQTCTWTNPIEMEGLKAKDYVVSVIGDSSASKSQDRGYVVVTMDNGDKAFVRIQGTSMMKNGQPDSDEGTWSYTGGTGRLKGLTGKGTYKGNNAADGFHDQIEGEYSISAGKKK